MATIWIQIFEQQFEYFLILILIVVFLFKLSTQIKSNNNGLTFLLISRSSLGDGLSVTFIDTSMFQTNNSTQVIKWTDDSVPFLQMILTSVPITIRCLRSDYTPNHNHNIVLLLFPLFLLQFEFIKNPSHDDDDDITLFLHLSHQMVMMMIFIFNLLNREGFAIAAETYRT